MQRGRALANRLTVTSEGFDEAAATLDGLVVRRRQPLSLAGYVVRNLPSLVRAMQVIRDLPTVDVRLSDSPQGRHLRSLVHRSVLGVPRTRNAVAVVTLPQSIDEFLKGKARQAVRTNLTRARNDGITCRKVETVEEQRRRVGEILCRRNDDGPRVAESAADRLDAEIDDFFAAVDDADTTLVVAAVTVDETWAHVAWFVSDPLDERSAEARYLLYVHVFDELIRRGVFHVFVQSAVTLAPGLRYFQRRLGFVPVNLRLVTRDSSLRQVGKKPGVAAPSVVTGTTTAPESPPASADQSRGLTRA